MTGTVPELQSGHNLLRGDWDTIKTLFNHYKKEQNYNYVAVFLVVYRSVYSSTEKHISRARIFGTQNCTRLNYLVRQHQIRQYVLKILVRGVVHITFSGTRASMY